MPDPQSPPLYTSEQFASTIRKMYPELAGETDDHKLTHAVVSVHPEFQDSVVDVLQGSEGAPTPESYLKPFKLQPPPMPPGTPSAKTGFVDNRQVKGAAAEPPKVAPLAPGQVSAQGAEHIGVPPPRSVIENRLSGVEESIGPLGPTLMTPLRGAVQAAAGLGKLFGIATDPVQISKIATNPFDAVQSVADVVSGGLKVGSVMLPSALAAAPLETISGLLAGGVTSQAVQTALVSMGAHPAVVQLASDLAAVVAGVGASHVAGRPAALEREFSAADASREADFRAGKEADADAESLRRAQSFHAERTSDAQSLQAAKDYAEGKSDTESLKRAENFAFQVEQIKKLHEQLNVAAGLRELAKEHKGSGENAFDFAGQAGQVGQPPPQIALTSPVAGLLPPARPIIGAPQGMPIEAVGSDPSVVSQPSIPPEVAKAEQNAQFQADQAARLQQGLDENQQLRDQVATAPPVASGDPGARLLPPTSRYNEIIESGQPLDPIAREMIDSYSRVPPVASEPPQAPLQLAENAGPAGAATRPTILGADPNAQIETVGAEPPRVAQASRPFPEMINSLGEQLSSTLENQRPGSPRASEEAIARGKGQARRAAYHKESTAAIADELSDVEYQRQNYTEDTSTRAGDGGGDMHFTPRVGGTPIYRMIVGKDAAHPESQSYIAAIARAMAETGAKTGRDLPTLTDEKAGDVGPMNRLMAGMGVTTEAGARRGYNNWVQHIRDVVESHAASRMAGDGLNPDTGQVEAPAGEPGQVETARSESPEIGPATEATHPPVVGSAPPEVSGPGPVSPSEPVGAASPAADMPMPQFLQDLGETPETQTTANQPAVALPPEETDTPQRGLFDRIMGSADDQIHDRPVIREPGEEGHLTLTVAPGDNAGLKRWLLKNADEYGDQDWHKMASDALEMGEPGVAWKLANIAAARAAAAATGGNAAKRLAGEEIPEVAARAKQKAQDLAELAQIQKQVGEKLPKGTTVEAGIVKLPGNPGGLDPTVTDMTLGRIFAKTLVDLTDPNTLVRITDAEGKVPSDLPKSLQMANQMADQYLRDTPDELLQPLMDDLELSRPQVAAHFARKISDAGRALGMVGNWVQANEESFIHLDPDLATTKGPGAAGRLEFIPEDRADVIANYMDILRRRGLTGKLLENMQKVGYEPPEGMDPGSKAAQADARGWLRNRQRQITAGKLVDAVAAKYNDTDTVMAAMGDVPPVGRAIEDASQLSLAAMISQQATAMKILVTHAVRYALGVPEEALAGVSARLRGNFAESAKHFTQAEKMATTPFTQLDYLPTGLLHSPMSDNLEALFNYTKTADPASVDKFFQALDQFPQEKARMTGARLQEGQEVQTKLGRVRNLLTIGVRASMMATRAVVGDAVLRSLIAAKGDDPLEVLGDPSGVIGKYGEAEGRNMLGTSVSSALNYTYAGNPLPDSAIGQVLELMHKVPGIAPAVRTVRPFMRFSMATVPRFIWDRMGGMTLPVDLAMHHFYKRGRLSLGLQLDALQRAGGVLDTRQTQLASARFSVSDTLNDSIGAMIEARQAKKGIDAIAKRGENTGVLSEASGPGVGMTRMYHGGADDSPQGSRFFSSDRQYAESYAQKSGGSVSYVDLPSDHPTIAPDYPEQSVDQGFHVQADLPEALAKTRKPLSGAAGSGMQGQIDALKATYDQATETANQKRAEHLAARAEVQDLTTGYEKDLKRANQLREIDAPNWDQYIARQTTGALLMAVAFGVRGLASNEGTKYYQHTLPSGETLDLREMLAGFAPYLHTADFFTDVLHHTDWAGLKAGKPMSEVYTGKYQTAQTLAQAMDDWFQVSYLTGTSGIVADLLTGRAPDALAENAPQSLGLMMLQGLGEQLGRFTTGFQTLTDYAGAARPEEALSRTPERAGEATPLSRILFGPALAHIPGASESLPAKISPFTGEPIRKEHPGLHQATGLNFGTPLTLAEKEINRTGLAYAKAVPKVTGDQQLDNAVAVAYSGIVRQYLPPIVTSKAYQARTPQLNRDVLEAVFHEMKNAAYATVTQHLSSDEAKKLIQSPAEQAKVKRWQGFLKKQQEQEGPSREPQDDDPGQQPAAGLAAPE